MQSVAEIVTKHFVETIAYYRKSPLVGARYAVGVLEELLTTIEQDIANDHRCEDCGTGGQWVLLRHRCLRGVEAGEATIEHYDDPTRDYPRKASVLTVQARSCTVRNDDDAGS